MYVKKGVPFTSSLHVLFNGRRVVAKEYHEAVALFCGGSSVACIEDFCGGSSVVSPISLRIVAVGCGTASISLKYKRLRRHATPKANTKARYRTQSFRDTIRHIQKTLL